MAKLLMPRYLIPILVAAVAVGAITLIDNDGQRAMAQKTKHPEAAPGGADRHGRVPGRPDAARRREDRCRALPQLRRAGRRRHVVQERPHHLRLHHPGDPAGAWTASWPARPARPTSSATRSRSTRLLGRRGYSVVSSRGGHLGVPAALLPGARRKPPRHPAAAADGPPRAPRAASSTPSSPGRPTLYVKHVLLPHGPYMFLPSGKQTRRTFRDPLPGMNGPVGLRRPRPDRAQPAAPAAADRVRRPRDRAA